MLFKGTYWSILTFHSWFYLLPLTMRFVIVFNKRTWWWWWWWCQDRVPEQRSLTEAQWRTQARSRRRTHWSCQSVLEEHHKGTERRRRKSHETNSPQQTNKKLIRRWDRQTWLDDIGGDMPDSPVWPPPSCLFGYLRGIAQPHAGWRDFLGVVPRTIFVIFGGWVAGWPGYNMVQKYSQKVKPLE